ERGVRTYRPGRQLGTRHHRRSTMPERAKAGEIVTLARLQAGKLVVGPNRLGLVRLRRALARLFGLVANRRRALLTDDLVLLIEVGGVAVCKHRRAGEFRLFDAVVDEAPLLANRVARRDAPFEPPLVAAK